MTNILPQATTPELGELIERLRTWASLIPAAHSTIDDRNCLIAAAGALERLSRPIGDDVVELRKHFERMIQAAANYVEPTTYIARHPVDSGIGLCKWNTEFPMPEPTHAPEAVASITTRRDQAFINDMIYMLDGPEQRAALSSIPVSTEPSVDAVERGARALASYLRGDDFGWQDRVDAVRAVVAALSALPTASEPTCDWPLKARVWMRDHPEEGKQWVLEIEGVLKDTHLTCRHTEPVSTTYEHVPGLPSHYATPATEASGEVVQADREAAALIARHYPIHQNFSLDIAEGKADASILVQAFRDHRLAHSGVGNVVTDAMVETALHARVPGGSEVWVWLPQLDAWTPHQTARDVMRCALEAALSTTEPVELQTDRELLPIGSNATYSYDGVNVDCIVAGHDEGWLLVRFRDDTDCVVRPSHVIAREALTDREKGA